MKIGVRESMVNSRGKMEMLKSWKVFALLFEIFLGISASTHWVVTENGRVQSQV